MKKRRMKKSKVEEMPFEKFLELLKELDCGRIVIGAPGQPDIILEKTKKSETGLKNERTI